AMHEQQVSAAPTSPSHTAAAAEDAPAAAAPASPTRPPVVPSSGSTPPLVKLANLASFPSASPLAAAPLYSPRSAPPEAHLAASLVQAAWRGVLARRRVRAQRAELAREARLRSLGRRLERAEK